MASKRGELIAERMKMLEHMNFAQATAPTLRSKPFLNHNVQTNAPKLRPKPALNHNAQTNTPTFCPKPAPRPKPFLNHNVHTNAPTLRPKPALNHSVQTNVPTTLCPKPALNSNVQTNAPTLRPKPALNHSVQTDAPKDDYIRNIRLNLWRAAPAVPRQHGSAASASSADAESAVPLLETHNNLTAASKMAARVRVLPAHTDIPHYDEPPPDYTAAESGKKRRPPPDSTPTAAKLEHAETTTVPQGHPSTIPWGKIRDHFSSFALWIQSSAPSLTSVQSTFSTIADRYENKLPIKRTDLKLILLIFLACLISLLFYRSFFAREETEIDKYFYNLNYSPDELLIYQGETLKAIPKDGKLNENKCIVIERTEKSISEIGVVASNEHRTFPGSLLLANQRLVDNTPDMLAVGRAPLTYTVNLPRITTDGSFTIIPRFSEYQAAVNHVLNTWFDKYAKDGSTAANFQLTESLAYSKHLLRVQFGLDFINSAIEFGIDFNAMANGEKLIKIVKFTQVFYTVSVEPTKRPSDLFDSGVTLSEIKLKNDGKDPPVLVENVSYGRSIYLKIETTSIDKQAELKLSVLGKKFGLENARDLKDLRIQVYVIGGHTNQTELIDAGEINEVITKFSKFSKYNLGFPISYSSQFIDDNQKAIVHMSTDYVETVRHNKCRKGIIQLVQRIMFVKWKVTWTEISYDANGNKSVKKREWYNNSKVIKLHFKSEEIEIPSYVEDLRVVAKAFTFFDSWRTVLDRSNIPIIPRREFWITGRSASEVYPPI